MRPIKSVLILIAVLVLPFWSVFFALKVEKYRLKKQIKRQLVYSIDREELVMLRFSETDLKKKLRWEHDREFEYDNEMYDVVHREAHGDSIYFWCWWDHEETVINRKLDHIVQLAFHTNPRKHENSRRLALFFKGFFPSGDVYRVEPPAFMVGSARPGFSMPQYTSHALTPPTPPPDNRLIPKQA